MPKDKQIKLLELPNGDMLYRRWNPVQKAYYYCHKIDDALQVIWEPKLVARSTLLAAILDHDDVFFRERRRCDKKEKRNGKKNTRNK